MPNKTENYQLNQWEPGDSFLRTDFNEDNAKIDAALGELKGGQLRMASGRYTGNGSAQLSIQVGFKPEFMVITQTETGNGKSETYHMVMIGDRAKYGSTVAPYYSGDTLMIVVERTDSGVTLRRNPEWDAVNVNMNVNGKEYSYFAIG